MKQTLLHAYNRHESIVSLLQWHQISRKNRLETFNEMSLKHFMLRKELKTLYVKKK